MAEEDTASISEQCEDNTEGRVTLCERLWATAMPLTGTGITELRSQQ